MITNDAFHAAVTKDWLCLTRPDGKDYSTKIDRAIRDEGSSALQT
jgi:hypothetical protein